MLLPIENLLSQQESLSIREKIEAAPWLDGKHSAGTQAATVKANLQLDESTETYAASSQFILQKIATHPLFISACLPENIYPPKFNCYQNGGHYGLHIDSAIMNTNDGKQLRTDISATLFLSNPDEYDGGELLINTKYGMQSVKLDMGDLIIYPSTSLHQVTPVTKGRRVSAFFWVQSLVKNEQQREILFDLDQSIQKLTLALSENTDELQSLTGIYHNLLRQWNN